MLQNKRSEYRIGLNKKLRYIIISMLVPLVLCVFLVLGILGYYAMKYEQITHNVNISSKFNLDFKQDMDLKMYYYVAGSKEQVELPISDVEYAITLAKALKKTTYCKDSMMCIQNVLDYCENLKRRMYNIKDTKDYDSRQVKLENNIYVLTQLIQERMMKYIYYEAGYMAILEKNMIQNIKLIIVVAVLLISGTVILLLYRVFQYSNGITRPISLLCEIVNRVGNGEFWVPEVETNDYEIIELHTGIQNMAEKIRILLNDVKEEEKLHHMTELQLLQAQINPHFLYNTLDTIVWLVETKEQKDAVNMLTNLSVFFRTTLSKGKDIISLGEELLHTRSYLDIQQVRYQDILDYTLEIPEQLKELKVPKLTLQPLAENALYHGVKKKRGKSSIHISCREQGEDVLLIVSDNGIGMQLDQLQAIRYSLEHGERLGFGLAAVHERVKLYFGIGYGIHISSTFGKGTTVEVLIAKKIDY